MRRTAIVALLSAWVLCAGASSTQTVDLTPFLMLMPNHVWYQDQRDPIHNTSLGKQKIEIVPYGQFLLRVRHDWNGATYAASMIEVWESTPTSFRWYGWISPVSGKWKVFSPPLDLPRFQKVNTPLSQATLVVPSAGPTCTAVMTVVLTAVNITKQTQAGTFVGCVRLRFNAVTDAKTETHSSTYAPNVGIIYSVYTETDEANNEPNMIYSEITEKRAGP